MTILRLPTGCATLLRIAAAPQGQGRVGQAQDGDTLRRESGLAFASPGSTPPKTQAGQIRCRAEIALGRSAIARARTLFEGRTVTIMRVGGGYNRTVARVTLAGRDVGSELVVTDVVRWQHKPDWRAHADEDKGIAAPRPALAGRGAADIQGISRSGGTAKSLAAKWARIAS